MSAKEITVKETFTREQFLGKKNPEANEVLAGQVIFNRLRARGVPVIGVLGVIAVEWGKLTIEHEDGLDGDEWHYTYTGAPMPAEWVKACSKPGAVLTLKDPLLERIKAQEDEL